MPPVPLLAALAWGLLAASLLMALVFVLARAIDNYAIVDVAGAGSFTLPPTLNTSMRAYVGA